MQKSNLFFTYLGKLTPQDKLSEKDENTKVESDIKSSESTTSDNEWLQEYEVIYQSYSLG